MKEKRKQQILKRKNFFPSLVAMIVLWTTLAVIIYFLDPFAFGALILFFVVLFFALLFTFSLLFGNTRRGFLTSICIIIFLVLRYLGIGNFLNFILLASLALTIELYFARK